MRLNLIKTFYINKHQLIRKHLTDRVFVIKPLLLNKPSMSLPLRQNAYVIQSHFFTFTLALCFRDCFLCLSFFVFYLYKSIMQTKKQDTNAMQLTSSTICWCGLEIIAKFSSGTKCRWATSYKYSCNFHYYFNLFYNETISRLFWFYYRTSNFNFYLQFKLFFGLCEQKR